MNLLFMSYFSVSLCYSVFHLRQTAVPVVRQLRQHFYLLYASSWYTIIFYYIIRLLRQAICYAMLKWFFCYILSLLRQGIILCYVIMVILSHYKITSGYMLCYVMLKCLFCYILSLLRQGIMLCYVKILILLKYYY